MDIEALAEVIWNYHHLNHMLTQSDCIIVLGSHDTRVAERGAELFLEGLSPFIVFSGGLGKITKHIWKISEAEKFAGIALDMGVPAEKILLETKSANTGENVLFTKELIEKNGTEVNSMIVVNKPYMERRTYATFKKHWQEKRISVTSPQIAFKEYLDAYSNGEVAKDEIISIMVGDLQRVKLYAQKGFQIYQDIPEDVWDSYNKLVELGFTKHLI